MKAVDYYKVMGVAEDATADEIKKAYRVLARKYHPDVSTAAHAEDKFKELGEAYEVLKDPEKREEYDALKKYGAFEGDRFSPPPDWQSRAGFAGGGYTEVDPRHFSEFFDAMYGRQDGFHSHATGSRTQNFSFRGEDIQASISITLAEAYSGTTRTFSLQTYNYDTNDVRVPELKTLKAKIPAGVTSGQKIRLQGQGQPGLGDGGPGDLLLEVTIEADRRFAVDGRNVTLVLPIAPWEAILGADVTVPTLGGQVKLAVPENASAGQKLRLKGKGLPGKQPGDQYVVLKIVVPRVKSAADRELIEKMRAQMEFDPRANIEVP